jgi:hypothetical protein
MRHAYIYILGILLLLVIGFFVYYYYSDQILGEKEKEKEGFQAGAGVFQLYEQRCSSSAADSKYFPSVTKSTAMDMCNAINARLPTFSELKDEITAGLRIPSDMPVFVVDSDATYKSEGAEIKAQAITDDDLKGYNYYNKKRCETGIRTRVIGVTPINLPYADFDGYYIVPIDTATTNGYCDYDNQGSTRIKAKAGSKFKTTTKYGYTACYGVKPAGTVVQIQFPKISGKGWSYATNTAAADTDSLAFVKQFFIRSKGVADPAALPCGAALTLSNTLYTLGNLPATDTNIRVNSTTYNILDLDKVYTQIDIAKVDLPKRRDDVRRDEASNIAAAVAIPGPSVEAAAAAAVAYNAALAALPTSIGASLRIPIPAALPAGTIPQTPTKEDLLTNAGITGEIKRIRNGYQMIMQEAVAGTELFSNFQSSLSSLFRTLIPFYDPLGTFTLSNTNKTMTSTQYTNILLDNIDNYYQKLQYAFEIHPIAFLRKGAMNFPSMLNTMKAYKFPGSTRDPPYRAGSINTDVYWEVNSGYGQRRLLCVDGLSEKHYTQGPIADWDTSASSKTVHYHNPGGWWCFGENGVPCWGGTEYSGWAVTCIKEYYRDTQAITDADYIITTQAKQKAFDVNGPQYNKMINSSWRAVKDSGNPVPIPTDVSRTIPVIGTMSQANMDEINQSINLAICLNFTDTSAIETQIRISSENSKLYMSPDSSALPEYTNKIENGQSTLTPSNANYNAIHCGIAITKDYFYLLPHHTRNMINRWATARYNRIQSGLVASIGTAGSSGSAPASVGPWQTSGNSTSVAPFLTNPTGNNVSSPEGSFFATGITDTVRNTFLDKVAQFYYEREQNDMGTAGTRGGQAIIHKFMEVFQVGNTIFDVRFEEYRKRGLSYQEKLDQLQSDYERYSTMNLSKEDHIQLEQNYLRSKQNLYLKDAQNVWGSAQDCGVKTRYVTISSTSDFYISQVMIIDSAGQNIALSATLSSSPTNLYYSSDNDDPDKKTYYDPSTGNVLTDSAPVNGVGPLTKTRNFTKMAKKAAAESYLTDGVYTSRWYPSVYRTNTTTSTLVFDLGSSSQVAAVRIILANNTDSLNTYKVSLTLIDPSLGSTGPAGLEPYQGVEGAPTRADPKTILFTFAGKGEDKDTCTVTQFDRFQVARIYTDYTPSNTAAPWTIRGYSKGVKAALTFDPKYNAGIPVDMTVNKGNKMYSPNITYNLNSGGSASAPPLICNDPVRIKAIFNEYNILVDSEDFRSAPNRTALNELGWKFWATTIEKYWQKDADTCGYIWKDTAIGTDSAGPSEMRTRVGTFSYPYDTENWNADERTLHLGNTAIENLTTQATGVYTQLPSAVNIIVPYIKSTNLDTAGGFCPALPCSDTQVMQSLLDTYNSQIGSSLGSASPAITKVHKAITPTPYECEYLVETSNGSSPLRKVHMYVKTISPQSIQYADGTYNTKCIWQAAKSVQTTTGTIPGVKWDAAPNLVDSTPRLTRVYNYAYDVMRQFSDNVTEVVGNLVGLGSAQLDPSGSGIVNALVKYRTESAAAAGEIRYFDDTDEMGNKCAPSTGSDGLYNSANFPKCRSVPIVNSLYEYYRASNPLSKPSTTVSRITSVLRAGLTGPELTGVGQCDYTFTINDYSLNSSGTPITSSSTTGLRCDIERILFSCNYKVTSCAYINPTPTLAEIEAIPKKFVQAMQYGSGSGSGSAPVAIYNYGSDYNPPTITAAGSNATTPQTIPPPPRNANSILNSIDKVNCDSDYAKVSLGLAKTATLTNTSMIQCSTGAEFYKSPESLMYKTNTNAAIGTSTVTLTAVDTVADSTAQPLFPYTIVGSGTKISAGIYEYRITTEETLPFGSTYIRTKFYQDTNLGVQLAALVPATPANSPNATFYTMPDTATAITLATQFIRYWNGLLKTPNNKIGKITGYYVDQSTDTVVFKATSATFGGLGTFDVTKYFPNAYFTVGFRKKRDTLAYWIYSIDPTPRNSQGIVAPIITTSQFNFTTINVSAPTSDPPYTVQSAQDIMATNKYRALRLKVSSAYNNTERAEIARIFFYTGASTTSGGSTKTTYSMVDARNATVSVEDVKANYILPAGKTTCDPGYELVLDPVLGVQICRAPVVTYDKVLDTACGIGYVDLKDGKCTSTGFFQNLLNNDLLFANEYVPRLRIPLGKYLYIDFGEIIDVSAYSFVLGSDNTRPRTWKLEGSINNTDDWREIHNQIDYTYPTINSVTGANINTLAFYNPGVFAFYSNAAPSATKQVADYSSRVPPIKEGFKQSEKPVRRMRSLRWKIQETQLPVAPYVHATRLQFHTRAGPIPADAIRVSNPQGTRRSPADGPDKLLGTAGRWVDYNKSEILITLRLDALPANPIYGFQFAVPLEIPNAIDYFPSRWLLEGSYDGHTWIPLHVKPDQARIMGDASPIYKFTQEI